VSIGLVVLMVGVLAGSIGCGASTPPTVRVSHSTSPPMGGIGPDGRPRGFVVDALESAAQRSGIRLEWVVVGDATASDRALAAGSVDLLVGMSSAERRRAFYVSEPWWSVELSILVPGDSPITNDAGLRGVRVAYPDGLGVDVPSTFGPSRLVAAPNAAGVAAAVCDGAADAGIVATMYFQELLFGNAGVCAGARLRTLDTVASADHVLVARRESADVARALRAGLDRITADGTLTRIAAANPPVSTPHAARLAKLLTAQYDRRFWGTVAGVAVTGVFASIAMVVVLARARRRLEESNAALERDIAARQALESDRERLKSELHQAQKLESIGRLAGGVAHDFNNLLLGIMSHAELGRDVAGYDHPVRGNLDAIMDAAQRSAAITRQLLAFARKQTIVPVVLDLNDHVADTLKLLRRLVSEEIELAWLPKARRPLVKLDPSQLDQLLANLALNGRDAIDGVGRITVETGLAEFDAAACAEHPGAVPGAYVMLAVSDSGCGMDAATRAQIFEPFFTTKPVGRGTGLGLATVYGIVRQNDGFVTVESEPGKGTTFRLYFPRHVADGDAPAVLDDAPVVQGGTETILLVEDEQTVRVTAGLVLRGLGYTVLAADSPEEAERIVAERTQPIDLLVADVVMPGMNGRDLAATLVARQPGMKCLFISGYPSDVITRQGVLDRGVHFLAKPFSRAELAAKIRFVLEDRRPRA
jgi:signal transduction histidine kinase/CheY-like chemotaxis protein